MAAARPFLPALSKRNPVTAFAVNIATSNRASDAAAAAASEALAALGGAPAALAIVFASGSYDDLDTVPSAVQERIGKVPVAGATASGAVFDGRTVLERGVLVGLLGGDGVSATLTSATLGSPEMLEVVPADARIRAEADRAAAAGLGEALCLAFAPASGTDGEALVAAMRKGSGASTQLAGALAGDQVGRPSPRVFADGGARTDRVVLAGVFTQDMVGVAGRHGCRSAGPTRSVTRSEGPWLVELDGRRAIDVWIADAQVAGFAPSGERLESLLRLAQGFPLGLEVASHVESLIRAPMGLREDGAVRLAASVAEGTRACVMRASAQEMLDATRWAGRIAHERAGGRCAGALVLSCAGRLSGLGQRFPEEPAAIARAIDGPLAGASVFGEIAQARREVDAFHNLTAVVVAWPGGGGR